jgi:hypothetical protein
MSRTAALVGVFGTVQRKDVFLGSRKVIHKVKLLPPSSDSQASLSHPAKGMLGSMCFHSIMIFCPA